MFLLTVRFNIACSSTEYWYKLGGGRSGTSSDGLKITTVGLVSRAVGRRRRRYIILRLHAKYLHTSALVEQKCHQCRTLISSLAYGAYTVISFRS